MPAVSLYSAPDEKYLDHISRCKEKFKTIIAIFLPAAKRILDVADANELQRYLEKMILFHDLGKLTKKWQENITKKWQENIGKSTSLPSHSTLGAAYLWKSLPEGIREPLSFAVAIHHTDKGLLGDNIERPDVQAILDGIANNNGRIDWSDEAKNNLTEDYFPYEARELTVLDLKEMARGLRVWAKGCGLLEQHQRRLQASLAHHILKLCDISAATERKEYQKKDEQDYYGGWLMVEEIRRYVNAITARIKP